MDIDILNSKECKLNKLAIFGRKFEFNNYSTFSRIPVISTSQNESRSKLPINLNQSMVLKIQDREFLFQDDHYFEKISCQNTKERLQEDLNCRNYMNVLLKKNCICESLSKEMQAITWTLIFRAFNKKLYRQFFTFENKGVKVFYIKFQALTTNLSSFKMVNNQFRSCFFFNKNPVFILPGHKIDFSFWFNSESQIVSNEIWKIIIEPKIYPGNLYLRLWGFPNESECLRPLSTCKMAENDIKLKLQYSIIHQLLNELLICSTSDKIVVSIPYEMYFLESDVFQRRNYMYFYHFVHLIDLNMLQDGEREQETLILLLKDLQTIFFNIQDSKFCRKKLRHFRLSCIECLQPNFEFQRCVYLKHRAVKWFLYGVVNTFKNEGIFILNNCSTGKCSDYEKEYNKMNKTTHKYDFRGIFTEDQNKTVNIFKRKLIFSREVLYIKVYFLMYEAIGRICTIIESQAYSNGIEIK